jgi:hypothetical protein
MLRAAAATLAGAQHPGRTRLRFLPAAGMQLRYASTEKPVFDKILVSGVCDVVL